MTLPQIQRNSQQTQNGMFSFAIHISPLPLDIKEQDLRFLFSLFGQIKKVDIGRKPAQTYFYGIVHFDSLEAKEKAKRFCNGKMLGWKSLTVEDSKYGEINFKKGEENWENQTFYEEQSEKYHEKPKKKVHLNQTKHDVGRSFGRMSFKNSIKSYRSNPSYSKSFSVHKSKDNFDKNKRDFSSSNSKEKLAKDKSSSFSNRKQDPHEISY